MNGLEDEQMNNEKERIVKIGRATFKINRRFGGSKSLKELLEKLILQENSPQTLDFFALSRYPIHRLECIERRHDDKQHINKADSRLDRGEV